MRKYSVNSEFFSTHEAVARSGTCVVSFFLPCITIRKQHRGYPHHQFLTVSFLPQMFVWSSAELFLPWISSNFAGLSKLFLPYLHWDSLIFKPLPMLTSPVHLQIAKGFCWQTLTALQPKLACMLECKLAARTFSSQGLAAIKANKCKI